MVWSCFESNCLQTVVKIDSIMNPIENIFAQNLVLLPGGYVET